MRGVDKQHLVGMEMFQGFDSVWGSYSGAE